MVGPMAIGRESGRLWGRMPPREEEFPPDATSSNLGGVCTDHSLT